MIKNIKSYSGQALAIIMVVLIVSSIIGFSVFTRSLRDKRSTIQERDSAEAYEVVDVLLDTMLQYSSDEWLTNITPLEHEFTQMGGTGDLETLLDSFGFDITSLSMCKLDPQNYNKYTLSLQYGNADTLYQVEPGQAFTFLVDEGVQPVANCNIEVTFRTAGIPANTGFMLNKIFRTTSTDQTVRDYTYEDAETYCLSGVCPNFQKLPSGLTSLPSPFEIDMALPANLDRAQIIAVNNSIQFQFKPSDECGDMFKTLVLRASATCNGVYRAKEVIVPVHRAHFSIFNYVLFNGNGPMNSNN